MKYEDFFGLAMALFEESCDALLLLDGNVKNVLDANAAAQRLSGLSLRELLLSSVTDLFQFEGKPGICPVPRTFGRKHGPVEIGQCQLRTVLPEEWIQVNLTLTRLLVRPRPLTLLLVRAPEIMSNPESKTRLSVCDKCGAPLERQMLPDPADSVHDQLLESSYFHYETDLVQRSLGGVE